MTERELERPERKSHESVIEWDGNPVFSHLPIPCADNNGIIERKCFIENLMKEKNDIFSDNLSAKKAVNEIKSDEIDPEYIKTEVMSISTENSDCSNKDYIKITNQSIEGKQQITMDYKKSAEFSLSSKEIHIAAIDFSTLPDNKTEKSAQNIEYVNRNIHPTEVYDNTSTDNLPKSKSHALKFTLLSDENYKSTSSVNFSCSSDEIIMLPKLEIEASKNAIPVFKNNPESDKDILSAKLSSPDYTINLPNSEREVTKDVFPIYENTPVNTSSESDKDISCSSDDILNLQKLESEFVQDAIPIYENTPLNTSSESDKDILSEKFSCSSDDILNLQKLESEFVQDAIPVYENISESTSSESDKSLLSAKFSCSSNDIINLPKLESEFVQDAIPVYENISENASSESDKDILSAKVSCSSDDIFNLLKSEKEVAQDAIPVYENISENAPSEIDKNILSSKFSRSSNDIINLPKLKSEFVQDAIPNYENMSESTPSESDKDILSEKVSCSSDGVINLPKLENEAEQDAIPVYENIFENASSESDKDILSAKVSCSSNGNINVSKLESEVTKDAIPIYENTPESTSSENDKDILSENFSCSSDDIINLSKLESEFVQDAIPVYENISEGAPSESDKNILSAKFYRSSNDIMNLSKLESEFVQDAIPVHENISENASSESDKDISSAKVSCSFDGNINLPKLEGEVIKDTIPVYENTPESTQSENDRDILSAKLSCISDDIINSSNTESEAVQEAIPVYENIPETSSSKNDKVILSPNVSFPSNDIFNIQQSENITKRTSPFSKQYQCNLDKNTLNVLEEKCGKSFDSHNYGSDKILKNESELNTSDNVVQTEQKFHNSKYFSSSYDCHDKFYEMKIEKESHKIADVKNERLHHSLDCTMPQTDKKELAMASNKETETTVLYCEDSWEDLSDYIHMYNKEDQDMLHKVKTAIIDKGYECEKSNDRLLYNEDSECCEAACYSTDKKKPFEREENVYISWQDIFNNGVSCLMNLNLIRNYTNYISRIPNPLTTEETETSRKDEDTTFTEFSNSSKKVKEISNDKYSAAKHVNARETLISQSCQRKGRDIKTLEDALNYFDLSTLVEELEMSLEEVRRHRKTKEAHELLLKDVDKQIQKLSFKFHPDKVRNKGGSEEEIENAQKLQAAINAIRSALNVLNDAFLEDLDTDHKYGFYMKLELSSLANENEVKSHIYEVIFHIGLLSEIKQQKVIVEIQKFLSESQCCVQSYFDHNICDFERHRDLALLHLKSCILGYKKLKNELETIEKEYKAEKLDNIGCSISKMIIENENRLTVLRELETVAKKSLAGSFQIFTTSETIDEYFMLPFVCYTNIILMCNVMIQNEAGRFRNDVLKSSHMDCRTFRINGHISFVLLYSLVLYFIDNRQCEWIIKENMSKKESKEDFDKLLVCYTSHFKNIFKVCDYKYGSMRSYISEELKKCTKMMFDFKAKEKELSENLEKFKKKTEEIDQKYERIMKENEELNKLTQQQIKNSKKLSELTSLATSEKF